MKATVMFWRGPARDQLNGFRPEDAEAEAWLDWMLGDWFPNYENKPEPWVGAYLSVPLELLSMLETRFIEDGGTIDTLDEAGLGLEDR